jgi:hypothetical protein
MWEKEYLGVAEESLQVMTKEDKDSEGKGKIWCGIDKDGPETTLYL